MTEAEITVKFNTEVIKKQKIRGGEINVGFYNRNNNVSYWRSLVNRTNFRVVSWPRLARGSHKVSNNLKTLSTDNNQKDFYAKVIGNCGIFSKSENDR